MKREAYLKHLIKQKGTTLKEFAEQIEMPYSTLLSMLNGSIGGAAIDNVIKICRGLSISISKLQETNETKEPTETLYLSDHEKLLIESYREHMEMHLAINTLLGLHREN